MTTTVTMLQTRRGEDGNLWTVGNSYPATDSFAAILISSNLATGTLPVARGLVPIVGVTDSLGNAKQLLMGPGGVAVAFPMIVGMPSAQYIRTRDGTTDTSYAELAQFTVTRAMLALMGLRGFLDIEASWTFSNVSQTKDLNILLNGLSLGTPSGAANNISAVTKVRLYAEGSLNDQVFFNGGLQVYAASSNALVERTIDLSADQIISFQAKWSADPGAAATIRLLTYVITIFPSPV